MKTAAEISQALNGKKSGAGYMACCPAHNDKTPSLSINESNGKVLVKCHAGCRQDSVFAALRMRGLCSNTAKNSDGLSSAARLWNGTVPSDHPDSIIKRYMESRGLDSTVLPLESIRSAPSLTYYENGEKLGQYPALIGKIVNLGGEMIGVQRIYLNHQGTKMDPLVEFSARIDKEKLSAKKILGKAKGGAVRLDDATINLCITEGIETAMAVRQATSLPTWAAVSSGGVENLEVPKSVKELRIWTDIEPSGAGKRAVHALALRYSHLGLKCYIHDPSEVGQWK